LSSVIVAGNVSGSVTLDAPAVSGSTVITLPTTSGTMMVNGPAFSAYSGSATSLTNTTYTKVNFDTEEFDTNNNFASSRFTPTVSGYYQLDVCISFASYLTTETVLAIYKNGSPYKYLNDIITSRLYAINGSVLVSANGTTDYFEVYVYQSSGGAVNSATGSANSWFQGAMVRAA
jgi:hypothetical protein